ncbi:cell division protein SepF [Thermoplasma volcanium]|nr:cell division protein SepF [Thermoplasma volcanium]
MLFKRKQDQKKTDAKVKYIDLVRFPPDESSEDHKIVKVAEVYSYEDLLETVKYPYSGNILIVDISGVSDEMASRRIMEKCATIGKEINGDVARVSKNMIMITPNGIKIDREKFRGSMGL